MPSNAKNDVRRTPSIMNTKPMNMPSGDIPVYVLDTHRRDDKNAKLTRDQA